MKGKSAGFYASSLEMLLDTMCNMLGGVIFIALMVSMVAQDSVTHTPQQYQEQTASLSRDLASMTASNTAVEAQLKAILQRLQDPLQHPQTNVMRLPNIENTTKHPWRVIIQDGKLYPLEVFSTDAQHVPLLNTRQITVQRQTYNIEPKPGLGDDAESGVAQMAQSFKANGMTNYYFAFWVYGDSFNAFARARDAAARLGFQYGWSPLPAGQRLQLSAGPHGETVLPQN